MNPAARVDHGDSRRARRTLSGQLGLQIANVETETGSDDAPTDALKKSTARNQGHAGLCSECNEHGKREVGAAGAGRRPLQQEANYLSFRPRVRVAYRASSISRVAFRISAA